MTLTNCFSIITALRGFHVFHNGVNSNLRIGKEISCKCELNNEQEMFALSDSAILPGKIAPVLLVMLLNNCRDIFDS